MSPHPFLARWKNQLVLIIHSWQLNPWFVPAIWWFQTLLLIPSFQFMVSDVLWILDTSPLTRECWFVLLGYVSTKQLWLSSIDLPVFIYGMQSQSHIKSRQIATEVQGLEFRIWGTPISSRTFQQRIITLQYWYTKIAGVVWRSQEEYQVRGYKENIQIILLASKGFSYFWISTRRSRIACAIAPPFVTLDPLSECGYQSLTYA